MRRIVLTAMGCPADIAGNTPAGIDMGVASWTNTLPLPVVPGTNNLVTNSVINSRQFCRLSNS